MAPFLTLVGLILLPGYVGWVAFGSRLKGHVTAVTTLFLILLTGLTGVTWPALVLAEIGQFSLSRLWLIVVVVSLAVGGWHVWRNGRPQLNPLSGTPLTLSDLLPVPLFILAVILSPKPFAYINGGRDHGIYVNTGIHIARTGGILYDDPQLAAAPVASRALLTNPLVAPFHSLVPGPWSEGQRLAGLTIRDAAKGIVVPHAFHLYPVWIAIFQAAGSVDVALWTTAVFNWLGLLAIYVTASHLLGKPVALLALGFLILNVSQVWFTHYPAAEIMVRFFFWSGLAMFLIMLSCGGAYTAVLAGLCFGYLHLTKLDTFFWPPVLLFILGWFWLQQQWSRALTLFLITYFLIGVQAFFHAVYIATVYFFDQLIRVLLPAFLAQPVATTIGEATYPGAILGRLIGRFWPPTLAILLSLILLLWLLHRYRPFLTPRLSWFNRLAQPGQIMLALGLGLLTLYASLLHQIWPLAQLKELVPTFTMLGWYLSPLGLLLGTAGLMQFVVSSERPSHRATWLLLLANILPLLLLGTGTFPDQFWAIRRFVPVVLPTFILFAAALIWQLLPHMRQEWAKGLLPIALALIVLILFWQTTRPVLGVVEYNGFEGQLRQLHDSFEPESVLLFISSDATNRVTLPLWTLFDQTVFAIEPEALTDEALATAVHQWQSENRLVYLLDSRQETPDTPPDLPLSYQRTENLTMPLMENRTDGIPQRAGRFLAVFDVYQFLVDDKMVAQTAVSLDVASGVDDAYLAGLYPPVRLGGLTPNRWTSGQVDLHFPTNERPLQLLLYMSNGRPPHLPPPELTIFAGDTLLDTITVTSRRQIYTLPIPEDSVFGGETADFHLQITPWIPAATGYNADQRELGVYLDWAKVIVTAELERNE